MDFRDCYAKTDARTATIGNSLVEAVFGMSDGRLQLLSFTEKQSGLTVRPTRAEVLRRAGIQELEDAPAQEEFAGLDLLASTVSVTSVPFLSKEMLAAGIESTASGLVRRAELSLFPDLPFIGIRLFADGWLNAPGEAILSLPLPSRHIRFTAVELHDRTDLQDTHVSVSERTLFVRDNPKEPVNHVRGNLFFAKDLISGKTLALIKDSPCLEAAIGYPGYDCLIEGTRALTLVGTGADGSAEGMCELYGAVIGFGNDDLQEQYKLWYRSMYLGEDKLFTMSNNWGDRSQDGTVCEKFMLRELELAAKMGIDIVQIDDGWQKGITVNSVLASATVGVWGGNLYEADKDFWSPHPVRFPNGLAPVVESAAQKGIRLGLWFQPDSANDFENWERDAATMLRLHKEYGIRYFKLDGLHIESRKGDRNFLAMLKSVTEEARGEIHFNLDITNQRRLGYLYQKSYGTLFVENRYTDWGNYYPHNTLRNLWSLSRFLPTDKFQFELLNNARNHDVYGDDPLAPARYTIDYEFASVCLADPLIWMEMSGLSEENIERLTNVISRWKTVRDDLRRAIVSPIGSEPSGFAFTGFDASLGRDGYLLLLRESTCDANFTYTLAENRCVRSLTLVFASEGEEPTAVASENKVSVHMPRERSYVLYRYTT